MSNPWAVWLRTNDRQPYVLADKVGWDAFVNTGARDPLNVLSGWRWANCPRKRWRITTRRARCGMPTRPRSARASSTKRE